MRFSDRRNFLRVVLISTFSFFQILKSDQKTLAANTPTPTKSTKAPTPTKKPTASPSPSKSPVKTTTTSPTSTPSSSPIVNVLPGLPLLINGKHVTLSDISVGKSMAGSTLVNGIENFLLISRPSTSNLKVFSAVCPHQRKIVDALPDGTFQCVQGHGLIFDIKTGLGVQNSYQLSAYDVIVKDNKVYVKPPSE